MSLRRFWIKFDQHPNSRAIGTGLGCGVTAFSYEDALDLLQDKVFTEKPIPPVLSVIEDVDVSTLDADHVRPNMGNPLKRGIWYPLAYAETTW